MKQRASEKRARLQETNVSLNVKEKTSAHSLPSVFGVLKITEQN